MTAEPPRCGGPWTFLGAGGEGNTWSGWLEDGTRVAAKCLKRGAQPPALGQLARLGPSGAKALVPIHRVVTEGANRWVFSELADGIPLKNLLGRGRLAPMYAVAVAMSALDALATLHQVGLWHGSLHAGNVHVGRDGSLRLGDYCLTARTDQSDARLRAADIQAVGVLLCSMLRVRLDAVERVRPGQRSRVAETPLVVLARHLARGPLNKRPSAYAAVDARLAVWEASGRLATRRIQSRARERLAEMVAGPPSAETQEVETRHPEPDRRVAGRSLSPPGKLLAVLAAASLLAGLAVVSPLALIGSASRFNAPAGTAGSVALAAPSEARPMGEAASSSSAGTAPAVLPVLPLLAPSAAGQVSSVVLRLVDPGCSSFSSCVVHVEVWVQPSQRPRVVTWTVKSFQPCGGSPVEVGAGSFTAQAGWTHVASENPVALPAVRPQLLLAVSALPDQVASSPLILGNAPGAC